MPTLILPPHLTSDTDAMYAAALAAGWDALRLTSWRIPSGLSQRDPVLYGKPLFADVVAGALGVALLQAPFDWLPALPARYRSREVACTTLDVARHHTGGTARSRRPRMARGPRRMTSARPRCSLPARYSPIRISPSRRRSCSMLA